MYRQKGMEAKWSVALFANQLWTKDCAIRYRVVSQSRLRKDYPQEDRNRYSQRAPVYLPVSSDNNQFSYLEHLLKVPWNSILYK